MDSPFLVVDPRGHDTPYKRKFAAFLPPQSEFNTSETGEGHVFSSNSAQVAGLRDLTRAWAAVLCCAVLARATGPNAQPRKKLAACMEIMKRVDVFPTPYNGAHICRCFLRRPLKDMEV